MILLRATLVDYQQDTVLLVNHQQGYRQQRSISNHQSTRDLLTIKLRNNKLILSGTIITENYQKIILKKTHSNSKC